MPYFLLGLLALAVFLFLSKRFVAADVKKLAKSIRTIGGSTALFLALAFMMTGRAALAIPLGALGFMLLGRAFSFPGLGGGAQNKSPGQSSEVRTAYLHMILDHDSGTLKGTVLKGRWKGRDLDELTKSRLLDLWRECASHDTQSEQLMAAYLNQAYPTWQDDIGPDQEGSKQTQSDAPMSLDEAYEILGLRPGASVEEIQLAHRTLMKKFHPDQGGSNYLATKINEAKDMALKSL